MPLSTREKKELDRKHEEQKRRDTARFDKLYNEARTNYVNRRDAETQAVQTAKNQQDKRNWNTAVNTARKATRDEKNWQNTSMNDTSGKRSADRAAAKERQMSRASKGTMTPIDNHGVKTLGPRGSKEYFNPTGSGSGQGRGGAKDREWKNHKWSSRERGKDGKWIYEYSNPTGSGNGKTQKIKTNEDVDRDVSKARYKYNLRETSKKSAERNTGREISPIDRAVKTVTKTANDVADRAKQGADFISKTVTDAVANTPIADLFKK